MLTTLTTSTLLAVSTATGSLGLITILALIALLVQKQLVDGLASKRMVRLAEALAIAIPPLLFVCAVIIFFKIRTLL